MLKSSHYLPFLQGYGHPPTHTLAYLRTYEKIVRQYGYVRLACFAKLLSSLEYYSVFLRTSVLLEKEIKEAKAIKKHISLTFHIVFPFYHTNGFHSKPYLYMVWFGLVSLFNGISTLFRLFNAKAILLEE